jgi:GNAT superfamily N-acetyltransferase
MVKIKKEEKSSKFSGSIYFIDLINFNILDFIQCLPYIYWKRITMKIENESKKESFFANYETIKKDLEKKFKIKITMSEYVENNDIFNRIVQNLHSVAEIIRTEYSDIYSLVQISEDNQYKLTYHNCITFNLPDDSHLRFSPYQDGLEITRFFIIEENQNRGIGSDLMILFLFFLQRTLEILPEIRVEITGAVGIGDNFQQIGLNRQLNFYQKFGFVPLKSNKYSILLSRPQGLGLDY